LFPPLYVLAPKTKQKTILWFNTKFFNWMGNKTALGWIAS
jgi:hypothetical protein